jgi:hypothetical protein
LEEQVLLTGKNGAEARQAVGGPGGPAEFWLLGWKLAVARNGRRKSGGKPPHTKVPREILHSRWSFRTDTLRRMAG